MSASKTELPSKETSAGGVILASYTSKALPELTTACIFKIILLCLLNSQHLPCEVSYTVKNYFTSTILVMTVMLALLREF